MHDPWSLDLFAYPLTLIHVVNEHKLHSYVTTVGRLEKEESSMAVLALYLTHGEKNT